MRKGALDLLKLDDSDNPESVYAKIVVPRARDRDPLDDEIFRKLQESYAKFRDAYAGQGVPEETIAREWAFALRKEPKGKLYDIWTRMGGPALAAERIGQGAPTRPGGLPEGQPTPTAARTPESIDEQIEGIEGNLEGGMSWDYIKAHLKPEFLGALEPRHLARLAEARRKYARGK